MTSLLFLIFGWFAPLPPAQHVVFEQPSFLRVAIEHHCYVVIPPVNYDDTDYVQYAVILAQSNCPYELDSGDVNFGTAKKMLNIHGGIVIGASGNPVALRNGMFDFHNADSLFVFQSPK